MDKRETLTLRKKKLRENGGARAAEAYMAPRENPPAIVACPTCGFWLKTGAANAHKPYCRG